MATHIILDGSNDVHFEFLKSSKQDPNRPEQPFFITNDTIVQCTCGTPQLLDTWEAHGGTCYVCGSTETFDELEINPFSGRPQIVSFAQSSDQFVEGVPLKLTWDVKNASEVTLNGSPVATKGNIEILSFEQKTYVLRAANQRTLRHLFGSTTEQQIEITPAQPAVAYLEVENKTLSVDTPARIQATVQNAGRWRFEYERQDNSRITIYEDSNTAGKAKNTIDFQHQFDTPGTLHLWVENGGIQDYGLPVTLRIPLLQFTRDLSSDHLITTAGTPILLTWSVENAERLTLSDGFQDYPVDSSPYEYLTPPGSMQDITLFIHALGNFGQQKSSNKLTIRLARFSQFDAVPNYDFENPEFYLEWDGSNLENITLSPPPLSDRRFSSTHEKVEIPAVTTSTVNYELRGWPTGGKGLAPVAQHLEIAPAKINRFELVGREAILGNPTTVRWEVENAIRVDINGLITHVHGAAHTFSITEEHTRLTLIVWGKANMTQSTITIPIFTPPTISEVRNPIFLRPDLTFNFSGLRTPDFPLFGHSATRFTAQELSGKKFRLHKNLNFLVAMSNTLLDMRRQWLGYQFLNKNLRKSVRITRFISRKTNQDFRQIVDEVKKSFAKK